MFDPFHIAIAVGPIAVYLILIGWIRTRSRPLVVTGGRDIATLALALSGAVAIGPMELFFPRSAAAVLGPKVWIMLALLYVLCVLLVVLASKPRLVVYGLSTDELASQLGQLLPGLDPNASWLGDNIQAPSLGISAILEKAGPGKVSQLGAISHSQSVHGWIELERGLARQLSRLPIATKPLGWFYLGAGAMVLLLAALALLHDPSSSAQAMRDMLRY